MKVAVTYDSGEVFQHFGQCGQFKVYEVKEGKVTKEHIHNTNGSGHGALAGFLKELGVDTLICGGIGAGARNMLKEAGIKLYPGVQGNSDQSLNALIDGTLAYDPDTQCNHHHEGEDHECHNHGGTCGS